MPSPKFALTSEKREEFKSKFTALVESAIDDQAEFFLKSFIFALGNDWKKIYALADQFKKACREANEGRADLNVVQASSFLQKHGMTRTAAERSAEIKDIDLNADNRISFLEYAILQYKSMILNQFYLRQDTDPEEDLSNGAVGVTGVGDKLFDELFTLVGKGLDKEIEEALENFTKLKKSRDERIRDLESKSSAGGVKGKAAANEIIQLEQQDPTELNRIEITLNAAKRKAMKSSGELALKNKKTSEEKSEKEKMAASRERLSQMASRFESNEKLSDSPKTSKSNISKSVGNLSMK